MALKPQKKSLKTKVFLVEDHPLVRRSLQLLISMEDDLVICGEADNGPAALEKIMATAPDVAVVDLRLKSGDGLDLIKQLRPACPKLKILVFTMSDDKFHVEQALRAGVSGYMTKEEAAENVVAVIRSVRDGATYWSESLGSANWMTSTNAGEAGEQVQGESLTERQSEVMKLLGGGLSTAEIAERLDVSTKTVASHREHIKEKLNLSSASELINYACTMVKADRKTDPVPPKPGKPKRF